MAVRHTAGIDEPIPSASLPTVALVIPSFNGAHHLESCLDSVAALDYPRERLETIVVDNGSTDGTAELLARRYPWVRVLGQDANLGFAKAVNVAARSTRADTLAVTNNDMRLDRSWLRELVGAYAPADGYSCVAGVILDWEGEHVDFADGSINFYAMGAQLGYGEPVASFPVVDGRELLFACGASLLVDRRLFTELGGFDPMFFAYFEDVDFGWRLWVAGHKVRLAAESRCFHRHHGTSPQGTAHWRTALLERNALLVLLKNVGEADVHRLLAAALCLVVERALIDASFDPLLFELGTDAAPRHEVPVSVLARLHAVSDFVSLLDDALEARNRVQALRVRSDEEIFALFQRPFLPPQYRDERYLKSSATVARAFDVVSRFPHRRATQLLVIGDGSPRSVRMAEGTKRFVRTVYVGEATPRGTEVIREPPAGELAELVRESDVVFVDASAGRAAEAAGAARGMRPLVVDLGHRLPPDDAGLVAQAELVLCAANDVRDAWARTAVAEVVPGNDEADPLRPLRLLVESPPREETLPRVTEELQILAAVWRAEPKSSAAGRAARTVWHVVPEAARRPLRPIVRRLTRAAARRRVGGPG